MQKHSVDPTQEQHERAVGEQFMHEYNAEHKTKFQFARRAGEAPDLVFRDHDIELCLEVTDAYYDGADAEFRWKHARHAADAPDRWSGTNFDEALAKRIEDRVMAKARNSYGRSCLLVVNVSPALTTASELEALLPTINIPGRHSFSGIYLVGHFGTSSTGEVGGYKWWQLA